MWLFVLFYARQHGVSGYVRGRHPRDRRCPCREDESLLEPKEQKILKPMLWCWPWVSYCWLRRPSVHLIACVTQNEEEDIPFTEAIFHRMPGKKARSLTSTLVDWFTPLRQTIQRTSG